MKEQWMTGAELRIFYMTGLSDRFKKFKEELILPILPVQEWNKKRNQSLLLQTPTVKNFLTHYPEYINPKLSAINIADKRRLLEGEWRRDEDMVVYGGHRFSGKKFITAELIKSEVKPPYRYEFVPRKHLVIIGRDEKKYIILMKDKNFPQDIVDLLEGETES